MARITKISEYLRYNFTEKEKSENAQTLARKTQELEEFARQKKHIAADLKAREEALSSEIMGAARIVTNGYEMRMIECEIEYDKPKVGMKTIIRTDDGGQVRAEKMTDFERQAELPLGDVVSTENGKASGASRKSAQ